MKFWILSNEPPFPEYHAKIRGLLIAPNGEIIASPFSTGKSVGKKSTPYKIKPDNFSRYGTYTDKLSVSIEGAESLFIASENLQEFLKMQKINAEFFDMKLIEYQDPPLKKYKIINLLDVIDCVDEQESHLIYRDLTYSEIQTIEFLSLDESRIIVESEMFLLGKIAYPVIVVKNSLKENLEKQGFQGLNFCEIDEFVSL